MKMNLEERVREMVTARGQGDPYLFSKIIRRLCDDFKREYPSPQPDYEWLQEE